MSRVERWTLVLDDQRYGRTGPAEFDADRQLDIDTAMLDHVGDQFLDDDAQSSLVAWPQSLVSRVAVCRGDSIAKNRGPRDINSLPVMI